MNVYICTDHEGHWPVGVASVVIAEDEDDARGMLVAELKTHGIRQTKPFNLKRLDTAEPRAIVLLDGEY